MRHQKTTWLIVILIIPIGTILFFDLPKSKLPPVTQEDTILQIDWNERINIEENNYRLQKILDQMDEVLAQSTSWIGEQQFLLYKKGNFGSSEAQVYLKVKKPELLESLRNKISKLVKKNFPEAICQFSAADNIFNFIFSEDEFPLTARLRFTKELGPDKVRALQSTIESLQRTFPDKDIHNLSLQEHIVLRADPQKLVFFNISLDALYGKLKSAFNSREILLITDNQNFIPVILGEKPQMINEILSNSFVENKDGKSYPVRELISEVKVHDLKTIKAGKEGEYYPIHLNIKEDEASNAMQRIREVLKAEQLFEADFTGSIFSNQQLIKELSVILIISVVLLYFILAAQFESLTLPLIVLIEIPIDIFAAFAFLKIFGAGINIMSLIGIVVMGGIIINDSILKIDTINQLMKEGNSLIKSILLGGQRRLKPILMTSLTTVLAMVPMLISPGIGSELQLPLALALLGGMTVGTLVSLYFIPLCYYYLKRKKRRVSTYGQ
jgi:multidrug efflux pump subunit AcrB